MAVMSQFATKEYFDIFLDNVPLRIFETCSFSAMYSGDMGSDVFIIDSVQAEGTQIFL
jgi:hypothetical protein